MNMNRTHAEVLREQATRLLELAAREEDKLARFAPLLDAETGTVIFFEKRFRGSGRVYTYTALKCSSAWYTSGPNSPGPYTTMQLIEFLNSGVEEVFVFTKMTSLIKP